jgi:hypothetical protein
VTGNLCFDGIGDCIDEWSDVSGGGGSDGYIGDVQDHTAGGDLIMGSNDIYVSTNHGYLFGTGDSGMYEPINSSEVAFRTNSTERIRIDEDGNVGIGTNTPNNLLHVYNTQSLMQK